jgi:hypothetical protein
LPLFGSHRYGHTRVTGRKTDRLNFRSGFVRVRGKAGAAPSSSRGAPCAS